MKSSFRATSIANFCKRFFRIDDTPHKIAAGAALGIFLGIAPGAGVVATLVVSSVLRVNRMAAMAAVLTTNTWSLIIALPLSATVGGYLFGGDKSYLIGKFNQYYQLGYKVILKKEILFDIVFPIAVGLIVVSGLAALFCYLVILSLIKLQRTRINIYQ